MTEIEKILNNLPKVALDEIDQLRFMNRTDTKFVFPAQKMIEVLKNLDNTYSVLTINDKVLFQYRSTYFDTDDHKLYAIHQTGKLNRYKIRYREYMDTNDAFLEIKKKNNKEKTLKKRIQYQYSNQFDEAGKKFLEENALIDANNLKPALITNFDRITIVSYEHKERITLDLNLSFTCSNSNENVDLPYIGIAEVKSEGNGHKSNFIRYLKSLRIYPEGMSKYCVGIGLLKKHYKTNNIKSKVLKLEKIKREYGSNTKHTA
ncbi:MAG: VTC domain-containing protein [Bacteroidales bacterium]|nr:VTC domain-containing protein [Bacteroidales bacterium]